MHCFQQAAITFSGQNYGANKLERVKKSLVYCMIQVMTVGIVLGYIEIIFSNQLATIFIDPNDPNKLAVLDAVGVRIKIMLGTYFLCGIMEVFSGYLRGLGYSLTTMICSLTGACLLRIVWVKFIFTLEPLNNAIGLYLCYPTTWLLTCIALGVFCIIYTSKIINNQIQKI
jgi:Na+-driven multidrug efflux pump